MGKKTIFTVITFLIGFMIAIQFQTNKEPIIRDTRDVRELRKELIVAETKRQQLTVELDKAKRLLEKYDQSIEKREDDIIDVLTDEIAELKYQAGLEEKSGAGIVMTIEPQKSDQALSDNRRIPPPAIFRYLVNELNIYGAEAIAVGNERIVSNSAFRDVNQITYLNSKRLPPPPIEIKVIANDSEVLYNHMLVSESKEYFEMNGFAVTFEKKNQITVPAYDQIPRVRYMDKVKEG